MVKSTDMEGVPRAALLQPDQPPVGGWMLLGRIVFRDEQVELPGKGVYPLGEEPGVLVEGGGVQPMMVMSRSVSQVNSCWRDLRLGLAAGVGGEVFHEADEAGSSPSVIMRTRWITHIGSAAFARPGCAEGQFLGQGLLGST